MKFIIMAGGQGTKLWPISRERLPKQFQKIVGKKTLFQNNVDALLKKYKPEDIFVSTNQEYLKYVKKQAPEIPQENYIVEPALKKDTGPASGYAMLKVAAKYPKEVVMFYVQPVVIRSPEEKYLEMIEGIEYIVKNHNKLVSGGMRPTYADMGSDYLRLGKNIQTKNNLEVYEVDKFVNRIGDYQKTKELIEHFKVSTHCNHYTAYPDFMLEQFKIYRPDWYKVMMKIKRVIGSSNEYEQVAKIYAEFEPGRIEYVTEQVFNNQNGVIVILPFKWIHITTWNDIYEYSVSKSGETYTEGNIINIDAKQSFIKSTNKKKLIATIGLENTIVINTDDVLLICDKNRTSEIKKILDKLKEAGMDHYL